jgi:hypothetical protein
MHEFNFKIEEVNLLPVIITPENKMKGKSKINAFKYFCNIIANEKIIKNNGDDDILILKQFIFPLSPASFPLNDVCIYAEMKKCQLMAITLLYGEKQNEREKYFTMCSE